MVKYLTLLLAGVAAVASVTTLVRVDRLDRRNDISIDYEAVDASAEAKNGDHDKVDLSVKMQFYLFNSGEQPVQIKNVAFKLNNFGAGHSCFKADQGATGGEQSGPGDQVMAPRQVSVLDVNATFKRIWRQEMKSAADCFDYGYLTALMLTQHGAVVLRFAPSRITLLRGGAATIDNVEPAMGSNLLRDKGPWHDPVGLRVVDEDQIKDQVLRSDAKQ